MPDIFRMTPEELSAHLLPVVEQTVKQALDLGLYFSYPNGNSCFIHEYKDGRKVLVKLDANTGIERIIKVIT